jgi:hypothetical protein
VDVRAATTARPLASDHHQPSTARTAAKVAVATATAREGFRTRRLATTPTQDAGDHRWARDREVVVLGRERGDDERGHDPQCGVTAIAVIMLLYWTGAAADMLSRGDESLAWVLKAAAAGHVFAAGHGEWGNDIPLLLSTSEAERVDGDGGSRPGVDYIRITHDGPGIVRAHEIVTDGERTVAVELHGILRPPVDVAGLRTADIVQPGFAWPTEPYTIHVSARFETAAPDLDDDLNHTVVAHTGTVDFAAGHLHVDAHVVA